MKLLLTSIGIANQTIAKAFHGLLAKDISSAQIAFVTTAGYFAQSRDKSWFVDQMASVRNLKPANFELIEFNSMKRELILKRLAESDAIFLSGGDTSALMHAIDTKELRTILREFAQTKLYCGISASTHIASKDLKFSTQEKIAKYHDEYGYLAKDGLGLIDFYTRAHYLSPKHPQLTREHVSGIAKTVKEIVYAIDDQSAVVVDGDKVSVASEGTYEIFNA